MTMSDADSNKTGSSGTDEVTSRWEEKHFLRSFDHEIRRQEDLLFGVALYFEGIQFLYAGQESVIETYRKELRNIIQHGKQEIEEATRLLEAARNDPSRVAALQEYRFQPCFGATHPAELAERAALLVATYGDVFSRRPRTAPLSEEEVLRLLNAASEKLQITPSSDA
jgi:hypothetical protein